MTEIDNRESSAPEEDEALALALEVLETARHALMMTYRFLDRALFKMPFEPNGHLDLMGTDGATLQFNPERVLRRYAAGPDELVRDYLHLVLHCVYYHPFIGNDVNPLVWDLASDIVVETACLDIAAERFPAANDARRKQVIGGFEERVGNLSAEKLYRFIMQNGIEPKEAQLFSALFVRDDHGPWYRDELPEIAEDPDDAERSAEQEENDEVGGEHERDIDEGAGDGGAFGDDAGGEDQNQREEQGGAPNERKHDPGDAEQAPRPDSEEAQRSEDEGEGRDQREDEGPANDEAEDGPDGSGKEEWEQISKQLKVDLESGPQLFGNNSGAFVQALRIANRRKADYRAFLRRFAELDEEMAVNEDEFDLVYYTYGLNRYGNMPLIEALEYRETKKVREFVIAIDTSGSVEGALVRRFVEETYNVLKSTESFFTEVNLRIMQCDARVQSDVAIKSSAEFDRYMEHFELKGFGGTDFRPVFARIDERIEEGAFENLRGLIYFTDGYGTYPVAPPDYETVFVFADEGYSAADVPPWAMRLYLDTAQLEEA